MPKAKKKDLKTKRFPCPECGKKFSERAGLEHHIQLHSDDRPFSCDQCGGAYKTMKYLTKHVQSVHNEPTAHECDYCGKKFHYKSRLEAHRLVHTGEKPYKCKWCKKTFNSGYGLSTHVLIHTNSKPFKCSFCEYACRDNSTLKRHEDRHRGHIPVYRCKICDKQYSRKFALKLHVSEEHLHVDTKTKPCGECGKMFRDHTSLNTHVKVVHEKSYATQCEVCGVTVTSKYNLSQHLRSHVNHRPYTCTFGTCAKAFKDKSALKKHIILHGDGRHQCTVCSKRFHRLCRLNAHRKQHSLKEKCVECDYCGKRFFNKNYLTTHITRQHIEKRTYICDICDFETHNKPSIVMHIKYGHESEMDRECKLCKKTFKKHMYLKLHYWNTHSIKYKLKWQRATPRKNIKIKEETDSDTEAPIKEEKESDSEQTEYSQQNGGVEEMAPNTPGHKMDDFCVKDVKIKDEMPKKPPDPSFDAKIEKLLQRKIKRILIKSRYEKEKRDLERERRRYNKRIRVLLEKVPTSLTAVQTPKTDGQINNIIYEKDETGKYKFKVHQCYVCFKLYDTKQDLLDHCQTHFDICNSTILRKCPLCDFVCNKTMRRHLLTKHKISVKLHSGHLKDCKNNNVGSRFYFEINNRKINKMDVVPSVRHLNKQAYVELDKKNREIKDRMLTKTKLVKKGDEWIVERENLTFDSYVIPKISDVTAVFKIGSNDYFGRLKRLSVVAKGNGGKMLYPCNGCDKICQTLSALKLHYRRHDPNPKPYKPKVWKHKLKITAKGTTTKKNIKISTAVSNNKSKTGNSDINTNEKPINRYEKPKPIVNKHKCDPKLKKFYETNIRGGDIEFWQFLKIYNKMTKEKIEDFSALNESTDFGFHLDKRIVDSNENVDKNKSLKRRIRVNKKPLLSKSEIDRRNEIKKRMRLKIAEDNRM